MKLTQINVRHYGVLSFLFLVIYVWRISFKWEFLFSVSHYVIGLLILLIIGLIITIFNDKKNNTQYKRYFLFPIVQLLVILAISNPVRNWQMNSSFEKANQIIELLETYKHKHSKYPASLAELGEDLNQNIPRWTNIGTPYDYELIKDYGFGFKYQSYYGYTISYSNMQKEWIESD